MNGLEPFTQVRRHRLIVIGSLSLFQETEIWHGKFIVASVLLKLSPLVQNQRKNLQEKVSYQLQLDQQVDHACPPSQDNLQPRNG